MPRKDSSPPSDTSAQLSRRLGALPLGLIAFGALILLAGLFSRDPIQDAATFESVPEAHLVRPMGYIVFSPFSNVLDVLTLLSVGQHIVLIATIALCYAVWWWFIGRKSLLEIEVRRRPLREIARIGVGLVILVAVYVVALILPRPMARLEKGLDIITVDFHSHTKYSHDGRPGWTAEDVRAWHRDAGFDVAFISDHRTFEGAREGWANNPTQVGGGTIILPAIEVVWRGEHVNVLDADRLYQGLIDPTLRDVDDEALKLASTLPSNEPMLVETIPGNLSHVVAASGPGTAGVRAIEIVDGSPRGLGQVRRDHAAIVHLADSTNLALVAGSDNHGWGRTAAGWTLFYVPGWRGATPEELSVQISRVLRGGGRNSNRVAERYVANTEGALLPLTVPLVTWGMLRSLAGEERIVWIVWLTLIYALLRFRAVWRRTPRTPPLRR